VKQAHPVRYPLNHDTPVGAGGITGEYLEKSFAVKKLPSVVLLLAGLTCIHAADRFVPPGNTLPEALQWLAACCTCGFFA
jgi:hypothetical protein